MWWLIKTEHGYMLEDNQGIVKWFDMACNCKAYCMEQGITPVILNQKMPTVYKDFYTMCTGRTLWWDNK